MRHQKLYAKKMPKYELKMIKKEDLLLRIQLLVIDVGVVVKDDVNGIRIKRYLLTTVNNNKLLSCN